MAENFAPKEQVDRKYLFKICKIYQWMNMFHDKTMFAIKIDTFSLAAGRIVAMIQLFMSYVYKWTWFFICGNISLVKLSGNYYIFDNGRVIPFHLISA